EQLLQNQRARSTRSSIDSSSHPHLGQLMDVGVVPLGVADWHSLVRAEPRPRVLAEAVAIFFPTSCRNPLTYRSPNRMAPSASTVQSQDENCASIGCTATQ